MIKNKSLGLDFRSDFQKLRSLIDSDDFINTVTNSVLSQYPEDEDELNNGILKLILWDRNSGNIKVLFATKNKKNKISRLNFDEFGDNQADFLSGFPVLSFKNNLFTSKRFLKTYNKTKNDYIPKEEIIHNLEPLKNLLKSLIKSKLKKDFNNYFAYQSGDNTKLELFKGLWRKGCGYPIDLMTEEDQDYYFWNYLSPINGYCVSIFDPTNNFLIGESGNHTKFLNYLFFDKNKKLKDCYSNQKDFIFEKIITASKKETKIQVKENIDFLLMQNNISY